MPQLIVRDSEIHTTGVFAARPFRTGERIHVMGGRRRTFLQCAGDVLLKRSRFDDPLQIGSNCYLDLDAFSVRFNHSCAPNAAICGEADLIAISDIAPGDEITFDYAMTVMPSFYSWLWDMPCHCGVPACRKQIGDAGTVPHGRFMQMRARRMMQDYVLAQANRIAAWRTIHWPLRRLKAGRWPCPRPPCVSPLPWVAESRRAQRRPRPRASTTSPSPCPETAAACCCCTA